MRDEKCQDDENQQESDEDKDNKRGMLLRKIGRGIMSSTTMILRIEERWCQKPEDGRGENRDIIYEGDCSKRNWIEVKRGKVLFFCPPKARAYSHSEQVPRAYSHR